MKQALYPILIALVLCSCATKKEILYLQDIDDYNNSQVSYSSPTIQPNDILRITVGALIPETTLPYNKPTLSNATSTTEDRKLEGYIVSEDNTINFPELGTISTAGKTTMELQQELSRLLEEGGHLNNPTVDVRLINAKVTLLGEVNRPGVYNFPEQNITLLQALGYAGDLTINGKREDILVMRESDSLRQVSHIDITSAEFLTSPFYFVEPNDVIVVNPNNPKVKSAGFVGNTATVISVVSILLSTIILITR